MDIKEFVKKEARETLAREFTKEGLFELKEEEIRGNKYHVFANLPQNLRDYFQFPLIHGEWDFLAYEDETYSCLLYTSPSPRDRQKSRMPSSA